MKSISLHTRQLHREIREAISEFSTIYILSSFIMKSGVELIYEVVQNALNFGADVKILTGDYLFVTQPKALHRLLDLKGDNLEVRLWKSSGLLFTQRLIFSNKGKKGP